MEALRQIVVILCVSSIIYGILIFLLPEGSLKKNYKIMVGIVVVATIVISFKEIKNINLNYEFSYDDVSEISLNLTEKVRENEQKNIENSITQLITNSLNERKIYNCDITIYTDISEQGDIFISDINIICPNGYKNNVLDVIKQFGLNATVNEREVN